MATYNKKRSELRFMVKTSLDGFNPEDRKLIRSHVMKGKNVGKMGVLGSRQHLKFADARRNAASLFSGSGVTNSDGDNESMPLSRISASSLPHAEYGAGIQALESIPPRVGSVASTMYLADSVKPATVEVVLQFSSIAKALLFPMESCIFFDRRAQNWIAPLAIDPAFLHVNIFTSLYYYDAVLPRRPFRESQRVRHHYHKAISLLRERLVCDDNEKRLSNTTISIVLSLAGQAFCAGDLKSAVNHIQGIRKIINLRGGLSSITANEKLITEILRCDLGIAVYSGSCPILFRNTALLHAYRMYPKLDVFLDKKTCDRSSKSHQFLTSLMFTHDIQISGQLVAAWNAMSDFCSVINLAANSEQRIDVGTFLHSMSSIMYNLLDMRFESSSPDETIRLGLLSFSCSVFLPWSRLGMPYPHLNSILRTGFANIGSSISSFPPKLVVWLLMASAVAVFDESDSAWSHDLLLGAASIYGINNWHHMQEMLNSLMWIGIVHDKLGKRVFDVTIGNSKPNCQNHGYF
ncbi:hypothetical protein F4803DRAFT_328886 [Xylaria telfairii]|nr:hypothetical protein F4803DRAFT_328886 [Xylaria telfairii]